MVYIRKLMYLEYKLISPTHPLGDQAWLTPLICYKKNALDTNTTSLPNDVKANKLLGPLCRKWGEGLGIEQISIKLIHCAECGGLEEETSE